MIAGKKDVTEQEAHLELRGSSEFNTQLLIENCSRKSLRR